MSCLGVHFALTQSEVDKLCAIQDEQERLNYLMENIEEIYFEQHKDFKAESDKSWDAMHRLLADGKLTWDGGSYPLNHTVLAGKLLYTGGDYIMSLKTPEQVRDVDAALSGIDEAEFRKRYFQIDARSYDAPLSEEDLDYTWHWFKGVRELYSRAATANRFMLFTADQ